MPEKETDRTKTEEPSPEEVAAKIAYHGAALFDNLVAMEKQLIGDGSGLELCFKDDKYLMGVVLEKSDPNRVEVEQFDE